MQISAFEHADTRCEDETIASEVGGTFGDEALSVP